MSSDTPDAASTHLPSHHWDDPDGSWWALEWDPARSGFHAAKLTLDDNGAQIIVDVVGSDGPPITTVDQLAAEMNRTLPEDLTRDLEAAAAAQQHIESVSMGKATDYTSYRIDLDDGSWWELGWDQYLGTFFGTHFGDGEVGNRVIKDWGLVANEITTVEQLSDKIGQPVSPEIADKLAADATTHPSIEPPATPEIAAPPVAGERVLGVRYRVDQDDGTWWELGWDKPLGTFFATRLLADSEVGARVVEDLGNGLSQIGTIRQLGKEIGQPVPAGIAHELAADAAAHPFTTAPRFLPEAELLTDTPKPGDSTTRAQLAEWEANLRSWEARLEAWAGSLYAQEGVEPLWTLPAEPVVEAVRNLQAEVGDDGLATFAEGVGMDRQLVDDLLAGRLSDGLDVDQISQVCEGLHCSPYDLWGTSLARRILHAYGPERWPGHIEPLAEGRDLPSTADVFLQRQLEAQAASQVRVDGAAHPETPAASNGCKPTVSVACYRRGALLAVEPGGVTREITAPRQASPDADYHFKFRQVTEPRVVSLDEPTGVGEPAPAGFDADPTLASVAQRLRSLPWLPSVDLVRFVDDDGREEWLGWNPASEAWEAWDDPRDHYPGEPTDVLDAGGFTDPSPAPPVAVDEPGVVVTDSVEFDERTDTFDTDRPAPYEPSLGLDL